MSRVLSPTFHTKAWASALVAVAAMAVTPAMASADETATATAAADDFRAALLHRSMTLESASQASKPAAKRVANFTARTEAAIRATRSASLFRWGTPAYAKWYAKAHIASRYNWGSKQFGCLVSLWNRESHWNFQSTNRRGHVFGIPQTKVSNINEFGIGLATYMKTPELQVQIGSRYISYRYGSPCAALDHSHRHGWY